MMCAETKHWCGSQRERPKKTEPGTNWFRMGKMHVFSATCAYWCMDTCSRLFKLQSEVECNGCGGDKTVLARPIGIQENFIFAVKFP